MPRNRVLKEENKRDRIVTGCQRRDSERVSAIGAEPLGEEETTKGV